ncbi:immunoglobulin-like domain-containing protein [Winogradskyella sp.]
MKIKLLLFIVMMTTTFMWSQNRSIWQVQSLKTNTVLKEHHQSLRDYSVFSLNTNALRQSLTSAPNRTVSKLRSKTIISFPNSEGKLLRFAIKEASVMHPELQAKYPNIRSYAGQGIDDATSILRFSITPQGFSGIIMSSHGENTFIEQVSKDSNLYITYNRKSRINYEDEFECQVMGMARKKVKKTQGFLMKNANDATLRTYRLAVATTGEYTSYHGGTKAQALAAINSTMTRVNAIFENDFNVTMVLIPNNDDVIYTNGGSDPFGSTGQYNSQLQSTLTSVIGEANYDVGHLFSTNGDNGNAGCIGCVCVDNQKGRGWTARVIPEGDPFDVDYVAHELGHQFGANHTFSFRNEGTNAHFEPGSGTTIMGYAGITGATDVQQNSDPYFHWYSIQQVTNYVQNTSCAVTTGTGNATPTVSAGNNYTIPKGTAFVLEGTASDADSGDVLTYCWEQADENDAATTYPSTTATTGVAFRSYSPTTDNKRYFPRLSTIKSGATSWQWEAVPNVARTLNFRLTVRDNVAGGAANNSDDMVVTVNGTAGPFVVNSPNTNVTWNAGTVQTVTWNVAGTTGNGVNAANVDIFLSTDGGDTYPIALASGVPNDGSHDIVVPNNQGTQNRVMVRGSGNIFFDISNANFEIAGQIVCNATVPNGLSASNVGANSANLGWNAVTGASYDVQYRQVGASSWTTLAITGVGTSLSGLNPLTQYEARVRSKCPDNSTSAYSNTITFTTTEVQLDYCNSASTNVNDEYISRVQLNTIDNTSGAQFYSDFTSISTTLTKGEQYTISVTPTWTGTLYNEGYAVWIDYNRDGDFSDAGEQVFTQSPTQTTPVSGSFTIPAGAVENSTRMRVSMKYNGIPTPCETFTYGEVEDYTVIIESSAPDTEAPVITLNGSSTINLNVGETYNELGATATDNIDGNLTSSIVIAGNVNTSIAGTYQVTYNVSDAAGNAATEVIRTVNVIPDTTAPVITLNGASTINLNVGDAYNELGATATDNVDGNLTSSIVIAGNVNTSVAGTYQVTYNVSDASGNAATEVVRTVIVSLVPDTTSPVITLIGASTINLNVGDVYNELGATATDNVDGDLTSSIVIAGNVNTSVAGTYQVTYNVSDAAGNAASEVVRTINVTAPSTGCSGGVTTYPYTQSFEGSIGDWSQSSADDLNWTVDAAGTPSNNTGPSSASQGSDYIYVEASGNGTGYPNKRAIITSPCFDLNGLTTPSFDFDYHMFGSTDMGSIALEVSDDEGASWTSLWSETGNKGNQWNSQSIDLSTYAGSSIQLRFNRFVGGTWQADIAIDNINLSEPTVPTCSDGIQNGDETGVDCGGSCAPCSTADVVLNEGYFETGWDGWTDGGSDCARRADAARSYEITYSIRICVNSGVASSMTLSNVDITSFTEVEVDFYFYVLSMENNEDFWLRYFNGSSWTTVQTWVSGNGISNNNFYNATVTLTAAEYNFVSNAGFRFQCDASGNNDQIFIDQVTITGKTSSGARVATPEDSLVNVGSLNESINDIEDDFRILPNPVSGSFLTVELLEQEEFNYRIVTMLGRTILEGKSEGKINVSELPSGLYFIEINDGEDVSTQKFIKK